MLSPQDIQALLAARHPDPCAVLGLHASAGDSGLAITVLLPGAHAVALLDAKSGERLVELQRIHADGLWRGAVAARRERFDYRLAVRWHDGQEGVYADAYAYGALIPDADLHAFREGRHTRPFWFLGAHVVTLRDAGGDVHGVRFSLWAPNAQRVSVVGSFNDWDGRRHPMRLRHDAGVWELFVPHAGAGDAYKFELVARDGTLLPLKADPYARAAQLRPDNASVVAPPMPVEKPLPPERVAANARDAAIAVYEVHAPSWRRHYDGRAYSWDDLAESLPAYAAELGFTHIELLPISEYPFDGSWGYQTLGLYAITARMGPVEGFQRFVAACRERSLGVIIDWVPAHFPSDAHGLARFDGSALYEYLDPREGFHRDWNTLIYNFGRHEVKSFLVGSALYWIERLGVDGLRVDAVASMLYRDYSRPAGEWVPNVHGGRENLEAIELFRSLNVLLGRECPGAITVAEESTAFPQVSAPVSMGGLGFHYKWNMGWMNDTLRYIHENPVHRRWHHHQMTFGLVYAFSENFMLPISHDEVVHGKGSMLGKMPGAEGDAAEWQRFANLRAYYGYMWGHPGKKLLFMGQEFAQRQEWNHDVELPWGSLQDERHAGVQRLIRDLNQLYRTRPELHRLDCDSAGFEWIEANDADRSLLAWLRKDDQGRAVIVVCNFTPVPREGLLLGVPGGVAAWREVLNTDAAVYGGSGVGNGTAVLAVQPRAAHGRVQSIELTVPPLGTLFLVPA